MDETEDRHSPEDIAFRVTMAGSAVLAVTGAVAFFLGIITATVVLPFGLALSIALSILLPFFGKKVYNNLVSQAKGFWNTARESGKVVPDRGEEDLHVTSILLILSIIGAVIYYLLQKNGEETGMIPDTPLSVFLLQSNAPPLEKIHAILMGVLTLSAAAIFMSSFIGSMFRLWFKISPPNYCQNCGKRLNPDFSCCPYCCETETGPLFTWTEWAKNWLGEYKNIGGKEDQKHAED